MRTLPALALACSLLLSPLVPSATAAPIDDAVTQNLVRSAQALYQQGVEELNEQLFWDSVNTLGSLFEQYPDHGLAKENYLTAAEILLKKIGGEEGYDAAQELLQHYIGAFPYPEDLQTRNIHLVLVQIPYTYRHDYNAAATELNKYYSAYSGHLTPAETTKVKLIEARIRRKQGDFAGAALAYGAAEVASKSQAKTPGRPAVPGISTQGEVRFCQAVAAAPAQKDGIHTLHLMAGVTPSQGTTVMNAFREAATELGMRLGADPGIPIDIFVFPNSGQLLSLVQSDSAFVQALDGELYLLPATDPQPLLAQIYGLAFKVRPTSDVPSVLAEGLPSSMAAGSDHWPAAARQASLLGKTFTPEVLLDPDKYRSLPDGSALAASFVEHLIARHGVDRFGKLYGGWETSWIPGEPMLPGETGEGDPERFENQLNMESMSRAFRSATGEDLTRFWTDYEGELRKVADRLVAEFQSRGGKLGSIQADDSTPEAVVDSWFRAMQSGDISAMEKLAARSLKEELAEMLGEYRSAGILEQARLWSMAIPYSELRYEVSRRTEIGPGNIQFTLVLEEAGTPVRTVDVAVFNENGKWRMANAI